MAKIKKFSMSYNRYTSLLWHNNEEDNYYTIAIAELIFNNRLKTEDITLYEVFDYFGFPKSKKKKEWGWNKGETMKIDIKEHSRSQICDEYFLLEFNPHKFVEISGSIMKGENTEDGTNIKG